MHCYSLNQISELELQLLNYFLHKSRKIVGFPVCVDYKVVTKEVLLVSFRNIQARTI